MRNAWGCMRRWGVGLFALAAGSGGIFFPVSDSQVWGLAVRPGVSSTAPDFQLAALENSERTTTLSEVYKDHRVLLIFWASWCPSCVEEIDTLNAWQERYQAQGLQILGINVRERREDVLKFTKLHPIRYPVLMDTEGEVASRYGVVGLPMSVLLAKGGKILYDGFSLPADIDTLLNE